MEFRKNEIVTVAIEDIGSEGFGIGKADGFTLFVKDAVVGDVVDARIVKNKKNYAYARLEKVVKPSPFRVEPRCAYYRQCGGCQLQALSYEKQLTFKQEKIRSSLIRIGGFAPEYVDGRMEKIIGMEEPFRYRNKAQYPIGVDRDGNVVAGFYAGRTHDIIANTSCYLGAVENEAVLDCVLEYMRKNKVSAYDEAAGTGLVRHVLIRKGFSSGEIMVCLVINKKMTYATGRTHAEDTVHLVNASQGLDVPHEADAVQGLGASYEADTVQGLGASYEAGKVQKMNVSYEADKVQKMNASYEADKVQKMNASYAAGKVQRVGASHAVGTTQASDAVHAVGTLEGKQGNAREILPNQGELLLALAKIKGMTSVSVSINTERTNVIMGKEIYTIWGNDTISDTIHARDMRRPGFPFTGEGLSFHISPLSFYQVNPVQTEKLYSLALEYAGLSGRETVWDLYCGIGTISLFLAGSARKVYGVEIVPQAVEDARENAARNGIGNAEFFIGKAEEALELSGERPDVIVVDPPRKGCDEACLSTMLEMQPERIVYVSCDPATLARDLKILCSGGYEVKRICGVDQFGMTVHVETVCLLSNRKPDTKVRIDVDLEDYYRIKGRKENSELK